MDQTNALDLGQEFGEGAKSGRMRMADGYGLSLLMRILGSDFQLMANSGNVLNIIEERHISKGARDTGVFSCVVSDGGGGGAAVDEKELMIAKNGHELGHELRIRSGK